MPVYDFICPNLDCLKITEKILRSYDVTTIECECGSIAKKAEIGEIPGAKRHVGVYFNYIGSGY